MPSDAAQARIASLPGVGRWSAAAVALIALGDADAVPVGDYHLPHLVSWALTGERRGDDARMLELLEPYRPHRGRVLRLLVAGVPKPPRRGPRAPLRSIADR
jgi:3-methyladenine DNA glycosylase/8-oxoguanine DNA glycosylase